MKRIVNLLLLIALILSGIYLPGDSTKERIEKHRQELMKKYPLPEINQELKRSFSFPNEKQIEQDIYIKNPYDLAIDKSGLVYVVDQAGHKIVVFDSAGKFVRNIGQNGQGPTDLFRPISIAVWNDQIVVSETGNLRIQFLDKSGKYIKSFRTFRAYLSIVMDKDGLIYGVPLTLGGKSTIVDVLNQEGKLINSFGEKSKYLRSSTMFKIQIFIDANEDIYIGRTIPGIIEKYTKKGQLIEKIKINYPLIIDKAKIQTSKKVSKRYATSFTDFFVLGESIFVSFFYPRFEIIELTMKGKLKKVFWNTEFNSYHHINLTLNPLKDKLVFYVARVFPEQQIDKFSY